MKFAFLVLTPSRKPKSTILTRDRLGEQEVRDDDDTGAQQQQEGEPRRQAQELSPPRRRGLQRRRGGRRQRRGRLRGPDHHRHWQVHVARGHHLVRLTTHLNCPGE